MRELSGVLLIFVMLVGLVIMWVGAREFDEGTDSGKLLAIGILVSCVPVFLMIHLDHREEDKQMRIEGYKAKSASLSPAAVWTIMAVISVSAAAYGVWNFLADVPF